VAEASGAPSNRDRRERCTRRRSGAGGLRIHIGCDLQWPLPTGATRCSAILHGADGDARIDRGEDELMRRLRKLAPTSADRVAFDFMANLTEQTVTTARPLVGYKTIHMWTWSRLAAATARCC